jgi:hypothetical protein
VFGFSRLPPWSEEGFARFDSVFSDSRNFESFTRLTSAVIMAKAQWTVSGLSRGISRPDAKSDRTYRYFLGGADWSSIDLAQQQAAYVFEQLDISAVEASCAVMQAMLPALAEAIEHEDMTEKLAEVLSTRAVEVNSGGSGRWVGFLASTLGSSNHIPNSGAFHLPIHRLE